MEKLRLGISGAAGRMGKRLVALTMADPTLQLVAAIESEGHPLLGQDAGRIAGEGTAEVPLVDELGDQLDVLIDFSVPAGAQRAAEHCRARQIPLVMATTGLSDEQGDLIREVAKVVPVVWAPSMSMATNLTMKLATEAAQAMNRTKADPDVEIIERHHRFKEDAPSGTALLFGELIASALDLTKHQHGRHGRPGPRPRHEIGYHALRTGNNPGEHTLVFAMLNETIELTVRAANRDGYASGALMAAKFVAQQKPGLYDMFAVLGLT